MTQFELFGAIPLNYCSSLSAILGHLHQERLQPRKGNCGAQEGEEFDGGALAVEVKIVSIERVCLDLAWTLTRKGGRKSGIGTDRDCCWHSMIVALFLSDA
jgi:hypothetical protein